MRRMKRGFLAVCSLVIRLTGLCALLTSSACQESENSAERSSDENPSPTPPPRSESVRPTSVIARTATLPSDDPGADGWDTEVLAQLAESRLKELGKLFFEEGEAAKLLSSNFTSDLLVPKNLVTAFEDEIALVERSGPRDAKPARGGLADLQAAFEAVRAQSKEGPNERKYSQFKFISVNADQSGPAGTYRTDVLVSLSFPTTDSTVEHHARWTVGWTPAESGDPVLKSITVRDFARTTTKRPRPLYSDVTASALAADPCYKTQLAYGLNHWLGRLPVRAMLNRFGTPGLAVGDVNGDGLDDLYLCQEPGLPNRLFLQNLDGTAREVAAAWGVDWIDDSRSALFLDLDNDGDQDLVVALYGAVVIARNDGQQRFEVATALPCSPSTTSLAAADFDRDGLLDLYLCAYAEGTAGASMGAAGERFVYHDAENGAANALFRNEGEFSFRDVTRATGLDQNNRRWSFAASWEDFDDDGDQDLYVANDYGRNNLYRNDEGRFVDVAASAGVEDSASGMSAAWGDYDRDGRMDLYVANMFSAAGSRITAQEKFKTGTAQEIRDRFRRFARGNSLFRNTGAGFNDVSVPAGVTLGRWAWSSNFVDLNNDAWPDLVVANGYLSSEGDTGDL
jgi:hypothetical protein